MELDPLRPPPLLTGDHPGIGGAIKQSPDDFEVEEIPAYPPSGTGDFLFLWVEKRGMGAEYFGRQVARRLGIPVGEVGTAGLKDRQAVTRQMVSVPARVEDQLPQIDGDGIRLLAVHRHNHKLRPGHLRGNWFRILIRDADLTAPERLPPLLERLQRDGLPNYYGPQRFGRDGETLRLGLELLGGERAGIHNSFLRKLALSAAQSGLFNTYLAQRFSDGWLRRVMAGDVMGKWPAGGMFVAEELPREQARFDARETVHAGPIFGKKTFPARADAAAYEAAVLEAAGLTRAVFGRFGKLLQGTRRHNLVYLDDLAAAFEPEGIRISVTLPAGSYATVLLRELMKSAEPGLNPEDDPG